MEAERLMRTVLGALPPAAMAALQESGFVVLAGPYPFERLGVVADAYDAEVGAAVGDDIRIRIHIDSGGGLRQSWPVVRSTLRLSAAA